MRTPSQPAPRLAEFAQLVVNDVRCVLPLNGEADADLSRPSAIWIAALPSADDLARGHEQGGPPERRLRWASVSDEVVHRDPN